MGLLRTEIKDDVLRVFVKDYPDSVEFPLVPKYAYDLFNFDNQSGNPRKT